MKKINNPIGGKKIGKDYGEEIYKRVNLRCPLAEKDGQS